MLLCIQVADFGMARQLDVQSRIDTFSCGTITHTAPELMDEGASFTPHVLESQDSVRTCRPLK
jgi:hypothetical protein